MGEECGLVPEQKCQLEDQGQINIKQIYYLVTVQFRKKYHLEQTWECVTKSRLKKRIKYTRVIRAKQFKAEELVQS